MMTHVVTGGAGFIGSHLCERLLKEGHNVMAIDDISRGSISNIKHLMENPSFKFIEGSLCEKIAGENMTQGRTVDTVFHLAAWGSVPKSFEIPGRYYQNNLTATIMACEIARVFKARKLILAGSSSVYMDSPFPLAETMLTSCRSPYASTKKLSEKILLEYKEQFKFSATVARFFNVYGPRQSHEWGAVIPSWIKSAREKGIVTLTNSYSTRRSFTYIDDVIDGLMILASNHETFGIYNVATDKSYQLSDIVDCLKDLKKDLIVEQSDFRLGDKAFSEANISKMRELGFDPAVDLKEGIKRTWEYYEQRY